jgi:hypothetical protein
VGIDAREWEFPGLRHPDMGNGATYHAGGLDFLVPPYQTIGVLSIDARRVQGFSQSKPAFLNVEKFNIVVTFGPPRTLQEKVK